MRSAIDFVFKGRLSCESFVEFASHRARRLDLRMAIGACSSETVSLSIEGPDDLLDAFEMACSLGPYDCIILDVLRGENLERRI